MVAHSFISKGAFESENVKDFDKIDISKEIVRKQFIFTPFGAGLFIIFILKAHILVWVKH